MNAIDKMIEFYNKNDFSFLADILDDHCVYRSQWVFDEMVGKDKICDYLMSKSKAIAKSGCFPLAKKVIVSSPCEQEAIAIAQGDSMIKVIMLLEIKNAKITSIDL